MLLLHVQLVLKKQNLVKDFFQVKSLKFNRMILPDSEVTLSLAADEPTSRVRFQWTLDGDTCSSGSFYPQRSEAGTAA